MKTLVVLRHAKSSWKDSDLDDFDRPLNKRGKRDASEMGRRLAERGCRPGLVLVSPARRARATIDALAEQFAGDAAPGIVADRRLYEASPWTILSVVQGVDDAHDCAMIVGHNPGLTDFVNRFADCAIDNIPTCGMVELAFNTSSWALVGAVRGTLVLFDAPKKAT